MNRKRLLQLSNKINMLLRDLKSVNLVNLDNFTGVEKEWVSLSFGFLLKWFIETDQMTAEFKKDWTKEIDLIKQNKFFGSTLIKQMDGKLTTDDVSKDAKAFHDWVIDHYLTDLEDVLGSKKNNEAKENYKKVKAYLDKKYKVWENVRS